MISNDRNLKSKIKQGIIALELLGIITVSEIVSGIEQYFYNSIFTNTGQVKTNSISTNQIDPINTKQTNAIQIGKQHSINKKDITNIEKRRYSAWIKLGFSIQEASAWEKIGFSPKESMIWKKAGLSPKDFSNQRNEKDNF